ncbi:MAG: single-stranded DNA-binding protein [Acholeplasmataceae bacterium]
METNDSRKNYVELEGKVPFDIKLFTTASGKGLVNFVVNVDNPRGRGYSGFKCVAWEELAEQIAKDVKKNTKVKVIGYLSINSYQKDGQTITAWQVVANKVIVLNDVEVEEGVPDFDNLADSSELVVDEDLPF